MLLTKIKEYTALVNNANKLGFKEIKLSKDLYIGLLAEINYILAEKIEKTPEPQEPSVLSNLNGGSFK